LGSQADFYKVGLELFTTEGPAVVRGLRERGKYVFLDLKLLDTPSVVERAVKAAAEAGADLLTVHASGGRAMLETAVEAAGDRLRLIGVTVLPSFTTADLEELWNREVPSVRGEVVRLAELGRDAGLRGVVASVEEVGALKRLLGQDFLVVTSGVLLPGETPPPGARSSTPKEAAVAGCDYLVVGRAVTMASEPKEALAGILADL
jgi:orotidine-5'-phosphate decarboxylase